MSFEARLAQRLLESARSRLAAAGDERKLQALRLHLGGDAADEAERERDLRPGATDGEDDEGRPGRRRKRAEVGGGPGPQVLARSEPAEARGEQRPQPRAVAADEEIGKRKSGGAQVRLEHAVAEESPSCMLGGNEIPDLALARLGRRPHAIDVRIGDDAVQVRGAVQLGEDGRGVESGDERRAGLAQVPRQPRAGPRLRRADHPARPGRRSGAIARGPRRGDGRDRLHQRAEGTAHRRELRKTRERLVEIARAAPETRVGRVAERRLLHSLQRHGERVRERERGAEVTVAHVDGGDDRSLAGFLRHGIAASPACPPGCQGPPPPPGACTA